MMVVARTGTGASAEKLSEPPYPIYIRITFDEFSRPAYHFQPQNKDHDGYAPYCKRSAHPVPISEGNFYKSVSKRQDHQSAQHHVALISSMPPIFFFRVINKGIEPSRLSIANKVEGNSIRVVQSQIHSPDLTDNDLTIYK